MALNLTIYSNANNVSKTITVDFLNGTILDSSYNPSNPSNQRYYLKLSTSSKDTSGASYPIVILEDLSTLALNGAKQSASNTAASYASINSAIIDYAYDMINGHTLNQFNSGCSAKAPMKFSNN